MIEVKASFEGGLNLDDALYNVQNNQYIDALNVTRDAIEGSNDKAITNIVGNQLVNYVFPTQSGVTTGVDTVAVGTTNEAQISFFGSQTILPGYIFNISLYTGHSTVLAATYTTTQTITLSQLIIELSNSAIALGVVISSSVSNGILYINYLNTTYVSLSIVESSNFSQRVVCIGAFPNNVRNTIIYFIWSENGHHLILEYNNDTRTISPIFINLLQSNNIDILEFTENNKITSINVYNRNIAIGEGDLLYFLDSQGRPTGLDILRFKNGEYIPVTRDIINVIKKPPLSPPPCAYGNDTNRHGNDLRNRLFRFKYRYVYDNNEKSVCSPISAVPLPVNILDDTYNNVSTNNNTINLIFNTGSNDVKLIEILMSYVSRSNDWSDFAIVESIDKSSFSVLTGTQTDIQISGNRTLSQILFQGTVFAGILITIQINDVTTQQTVFFTYTTLPGDTILDIVAGLNLASPSLPGLYFFQIGDNVIQAVYDNTLFFGYRFSIDNLLPNFDNVDYYYDFYNDSTYPIIDINESIQIYDYVPDKANAQEMANGNVLLYGGITEGYDRTLLPNVVNDVLTVPAGAGIPIGSLNVVATFKGNLFPGADLYEAQFSGIPIDGTVIRLKFKRLSDNAIVYGVNIVVGVNSPFPIQWYPPINTEQVMQRSVQYMNVFGTDIAVVYRVYFGQAKFEYYVFPETNELLGWEIIPPITSVKNSIPTFLFSTQRRLGLAYFDKNGKTNGILYNGELTFPSYNEDSITHDVLLPYINTKIYHQPPEWAYSYNFYLTKEATQFLYWEVAGVVTTETDYYFFDISNIDINQKKFPTTANVVDYKFQDGDRMRLIKKVSDSTIYSDLYDAAIEGVVIDPGGSVPPGTYVKIKKFNPFTTVDYSSLYFIIQLYRPEQQASNLNNQVFYEFGQQYYIGNPGLSTRSHMGMVSNQNLSINTPAEFNFYYGDVYFRSRTIALSVAAVDEYFAIDRNFVDNYISAVNSIDGRPSVIDINARKAYYSTLVRFGQAYQPNTNINGLNRFYPLNFDEYDYSYGDIMRFKVRDRFVRVFQKLKVGQVPLYNQILKEQNKESLVVTDKLLNPVQYYVGDVGIGDHPESLASYNFADYFVSNIKGMIARVSNDGVKFISIDRNIDSWAWYHISQRGGDYKIYGAFDQVLGNYIIALEATQSDPAYTLVYDENENTFDSFLSYHPEMMVNLGVLYVTFKNGNLYTHDATTYNNFYGSQYDSYITFVFNQLPTDRKTFTNISEVASQIWDVPELRTDVRSYGTTVMESNLVDSDFALLEGGYEAAILKDINSIGGILDGDAMKGRIMTVKFRAQNPTSLISLNLVSLKYINSPLNSR